MVSLRIHCFQHVAFEDLGCIKTWIQKQGHKLTYTKFYTNYTLPSINDFDMLVVMGGPMGAYDEALYDWMAPEKEIIKKAIEKQKIVIGICLGAQLIANVLGAKVYKNNEKEIGWYPIDVTPQAQQHTLFKSISDYKFTVFHWHGDTFELPINAVRLASSQVCLNQAFIYNNHVLALQFHVEVTEQSLIEMVNNGRQELTIGTFVQNEREIMQYKVDIEPNNNRLYQLFDNLIELQKC